MRSDYLRRGLFLTPHGHLIFGEYDGAPELARALAERLGDAFARGVGHGLLHLGGELVDVPLPAELGFWREVGERVVAGLCARHDASGRRPSAPPPPPDLPSLVDAAPAMPGSEYLTPEVLSGFWMEAGRAFLEELEASGLPVEDFLKRLNPAWNVVGRVHFNLAENPGDSEAPFAFLATYTHRLASGGKARHLPLGQALREFAGAANHGRLLSLLVPVQRAAETCWWVKALIDSGEIFHPLRWAAAAAVRMLADVAALERAGVVVRMPAKWKDGRPPRPRVTATVGSGPSGMLGAGALLDFSVEVTLEGEPVSKAELREILASTQGLAFVRGRWVEVDPERFRETLEQFREAESLAKRGMTFAEAMRSLAGAHPAWEDATAEADPGWSGVEAGPWLAETLRGLRSPESLAAVDPGGELDAVLRPYQQVGLRWLHCITSLGLGACLADDMGLGKTIQVLALLLVLRRSAAKSSSAPSLLVAPASLMANWAAEIRRFAPRLRFMVAHPSALPAEALREDAPPGTGQLDLVITTYGSLPRVPWISGREWGLVVIDEAQAIKNPGTKQTRAVKELRARARIALTGTPVENRLTDLWSIFDFINPGLLGTGAAFARYAKRISKEGHNPYGPLRSLVRPYILRRLKTDKSVIADLPDKMEVRAYCPLSRKQAALYQQGVEEFAARVASSDGMRRKGLVLAYLTRFKQICNHPSHWLGDGSWKEGDSGKLARLRELCEVVASKQEKALVFTQFREIADPLSAFLSGVFGRGGVVLHGGTSVAKRQELVARFQEDERVPFFVLSLKAGGSGLNLTAASHVIHFDRWWNPAVENQATDRAFRIGQSRNVMVHKFVCRGTVEEKIDDLIESKKQLAADLLEGGGEVNLTEMSDKQLVELFALDLNAAAGE